MTEQTTQTTTAENGDQIDAAQDRPDYLPEQFWKEGAADVEGLSSAYSELSAYKAVQDERAKLVPSEASEYAFALPEDFKVPEGLDFTISDDDPRKDALQAWAKDAGITKGDFSKLLAIQAQHDAAALQSIKEKTSSEIEKLGANGATRVSGLYQTLKGSLPQAQAEALASSLTSADAVRAVEKLIQNAAGVTPPAAQEQAGNDRGLIGRDWAGNLDRTIIKGAN